MTQVSMWLGLPEEIQICLRGCSTLHCLGCPLEPVEAAGLMYPEASSVQLLVHLPQDDMIYYRATRL